jgi:hypothetical protein
MEIGGVEKMAEFKFLQISQDRHDHWTSCEQLNCSGESWQEALQNELKNLSDDALYETRAIYHFEDGEFESCYDEIWAEQDRRRKIEAEKEKQKLLLEQEKKQEQEKALYLELKKKYG